jgi:hypothetical protein
LKKELVFVYFLLVVFDFLFYTLNLHLQFLIAKNCIPILLIFSLIYTKSHALKRNDYLMLVALVLLSAGLNFSYFFHTKPIYLPVITIIYFFEIQIQLYLVLDKLKRINTKETKAFTKTFLIFSLSLLTIIVFFPFFSFPIQLLFFVRVFQYAYFLSLTFGNRRLNPQISWSLWLIILSNISLLIDLVLFKYDFEYIIIMTMFYSSKFLFLSGYLNFSKMNRRDVRMEY